MSKPQPLKEREQALIERYSYCQLGMTPQRFYAKWLVNHEAMAKICHRSLSTVRRWFMKGQTYRRPTANDLRHLALMDFLLEHFEVIVDLESLKDERQRTNVVRVKRKDQRKFRDMLKEAFQGKCPITSCDVETAMEAAHIFPYRGPQTD